MGTPKTRGPGRKPSVRKPLSKEEIAQRAYVTRYTNRFGRAISPEAVRMDLAMVRQNPHLTARARRALIAIAAIRLRELAAKPGWPSSPRTR